MCGKDVWKGQVLTMEWKWGVMDGDRGDAGNNELTCVRSDESDKSSWSVGRQSSLRLAPQRSPTVCAVLSSVCTTTVDNSGVYVYYLKGIVSVCFRCPAMTVGFSGTRLYLCTYRRHSSTAYPLSVTCWSVHVEGLWRMRGQRPVIVHVYQFRSLSIVSHSGFESASRSCGFCTRMLVPPASGGSAARFVFDTTGRNWSR